VTKNKPINLRLTTIHFPISAITSILHRISGVLLFFFIPIVLWALDLSLANQASFASLKKTLTQPVSKFAIWGMLAFVAYHIVAGIRHLMMDWGWGETRKSATYSAYLLIVTTLVLVILIGFWVW